MNISDVLVGLIATAAVELAGRRCACAPLESYDESMRINRAIVAVYDGASDLLGMWPKSETRLVYWR